MTISFDLSSNKITEIKIENNNLENSDDNLTNYNGSGDEIETDNEYIEYFNCFICKKECKWDEDCFFIEEDEETGKLKMALCGTCKYDNIVCNTCDEDLGSSDTYLEQVKYLLLNFGKIENCISCKVTNKEFILKPNIEELEIGKDKDDFDYKLKYEYLSEKHRILKNIYQAKEQQCSDLLAQNESIILDRDKYKNRLIIFRNKLKENNILHEDEFLQFLENYKNNNLSQNINNIDKINPLNNNDLKHLEKKVKNIGIKYKYSELKFKLIELKKDTLKYKIDRRKFKNQVNNTLNEINTLKSDIKNMQIFKIDFDEIVNEYKNVLKIEKDEQIKKLYKKLIENKNVSQNKENNLIKIINKLENQKVEKLYILADLGSELKKDNIRDESEFLEKTKGADNMYYIYDLKSKNKISRFMNMCNKLYLLKDKIDLGNILKNNVLTQIRDISNENFEYLLSLF